MSLAVATVTSLGHRFRTWRPEAYRPPGSSTCASPGCSVCTVARGELHRYGVDGRTVCGKRLRQPADKPIYDSDGRPIKPQSISYTCRDEWTTCPDCLAGMEDR